MNEKESMAYIENLPKEKKERLLRYLLELTDENTRKEVQSILARKEARSA